MIQPRESSPKPPRDPSTIETRWRPFYSKLLERRDALIESARDLESKAREIAPRTLQESPGSVGTEEFHRDQLLASRTLDQATLEEVNAALARIEDGTYGICEATGKPIPQERLMALPWTRFTVEAQQEIEAQGAFSKAELGPRGERGPTAGLGSGHRSGA